MILLLIGLLLLKLLGLVVLTGWLIGHGAVTVTLSAWQAFGVITYVALLTVFAIVGLAAYHDTFR